MPPVAHPLLGAMALRVWNAAGVREGLLEQQVSLGWGIVALGLIAVAGWVLRHRPPARSLYVPVLVIVAVAALVCSLSPERTIGHVHLRPALGAALRPRPDVPVVRAVRGGRAAHGGAAGGHRRRSASRAPAPGERRSRAIALVALAAAEYAVSPPALWRDVLPTTAHRWVMQQPDPVRVLDCTPLTQESESVQWLTGDRVTLLGGSFRRLHRAEPSLKLAAQRVHAPARAA